MKKFLKNSTVFLLIPGVLCTLWSVFVVVTDYRSYTGSLAAPEGATLAICADSQAREALNPEIVTGLFNFSSPATTCDQDFLRLKDVLAANPGRFKHVLLDISPLKIGYDPSRPLSDLNAARVHAMLHLFHCGDPANIRPVGSLCALWRDVVLARKFNERRKALLRGKAWRSSMAGEFRPSGVRGLVNMKYREKAFTDIAEKADRLNRRPAATPDLPVFAILQESIDLVRSWGATPVVVSMPLSRPLLQAVAPDRLEAFRREAKAVASRNGIAYLDFTDTPLDDALWHDGNHLNLDGAEVFSALFRSAFEKAAAGDAAPGAWAASVRARLVKVCETARAGTPSDISGIACQGGDAYWAVCDSRGELCRMRIAVDAATGRVTGCGCAGSLRVPGGDDMEGLAFDPLRRSLWISDERGPRIFEYDPESNRPGGAVELPSELRNTEKNRALEAVEISPDGLTLWTCNENTLNCDSGRLAGGREMVRLTRFSRTSGEAPWRMAGQYAYLPERPGVNYGGVRNGVSALCSLPDGRLLVLERERAVRNGPRFRSRIFAVDFSKATDISSPLPKEPGEPVPVAKDALFDAFTGKSMYEGMCLGPELDDGTNVLVLVSDGDGEALESVMTLRFSGGD